MNFSDKIIISFYALFAISFFIAIMYIDLSFEDIPVPKWILQAITELEFEKDVDVEKTRIFNAMADIEQYPLILPRNVLSVKILEKNETETRAEIEVIEQNTTSLNQFVRTVSITAKELPVIKAIVKFDSNVLPKFIMSELLEKKYGIGTILNSNNIQATRNIISLNRNSDESKVSREYEIIHNGTVWFNILEEIRLSHLDSDNNS